MAWKMVEAAFGAVNGLFKSASKEARVDSIFGSFNGWGVGW